MHALRIGLEDVLRAVGIRLEQVHVRRRRREVEERVARSSSSRRDREWIAADRELKVVARTMVEVDAEVRAIVAAVIAQHAVLRLLRDGGEEVRLLAVLRDR